MRLFCIFIDAAIILLFSSMSIKSFSYGGDDWIFYCMFSTIAALNVFTLIKLRADDLPIGWIRLYIRRKALEEKARISNLSN
jgi:hypothetical protein